MGRVQVSVDVPGQIVGAEELWYDRDRWYGFIDGFGHVARIDAGWPAEGATLIWDSRPGGRGRVVERSIAYEVRRGQTAEIEDERLRGTQTIAFAPLEDGVEVTLALEYQLKDAGRLRAVVDVLFIRRALADSMRRTLGRFARELAADRELLR
jgi:Polyketide cyclase / dehydrase and lipid transport